MYHAALRHPEISKPQSLARATKPHETGNDCAQPGQAAFSSGASSVPQVGKQRAQN